MNVRLSHLRITASAGTGKTFRLTDRIVELVLLGVEPRKILALTFTRKAAGEFLRKLLEKLSQGAEKSGGCGVGLDSEGEVGAVGGEGGVRRF